MNNYIFPQWSAPKNVKAAVTTRQGGFSKPPFDTFNLSIHGKEDDPAALTANQNKLIHDLKLPTKPIWLRQIHSNIAVPADIVHLETQADASYTTTSNIVCAILTADCLPVFLCDKQGSEVAAIHAGWRGLLSGVIENTILNMRTKPENLLAWLGPAIGPEKFEVDAVVYAPFVAADPQADLAFKPTYPGKWLANIFLLAQQRLKKIGVTSIYGGGLCTYSNSELFFSHRRDKGTTGRMASLIWLEN